MAAKKVMVMVGTKKGVFLCFSDEARSTWWTQGPFFAGRPAYHVNYDPRSGTVLAAVASEHWGPSLERSQDLGRTWERSVEGLEFASDSGLALSRVWHIAPAPADQPGVVYAGVEPAALFKSLDGGASWQEVLGINRHPTRENWMAGGGGLCLHTVVPHPTDPERVTIAASAVGSFRTEDGGMSWQPVNKGVRADFMPDPYPEYGQCVHKVVSHPSRPETLYQQNHCGVFRTTNGGECWEDIGEGRLPSRFGFPMAIHPHDPSTIYTVPLQSDEVRTPVDGQLAVWRSRDGGESWQASTCGLPGPGAYITVLREGLATDGFDQAGVYAGTTAGQLFHSSDEGDHWQTLASYLPSVLSVETAIIEY